MKLLNSFLVIFLFLSPQIYSQDFFDHITNPSCGTGSSVGGYCGYPTYFPMTNDTLKALVIFANYLESDWDPINNNSNLIYMQYWPGSSYDVKPSWADSVICPTTTNVWHPSLTGQLAQSSNGKFWLIGDVYPNLVITDHDYTYYSPANGRRIGHAVKEIIDKVTPNVNWADYDKFDPCDIDSDGNRRETDGQVDFIFIIFRFTVSGVTDGYSYSGVASLGGITGTFGDSTVITRQGKKISASWPGWDGPNPSGSGCISEMHHKWLIGVPQHEFAFHYAFGGDTDNDIGSHNIQGGGIASARDREELSWNFGNNYQPTTNTTNINLRDYVTTGDHIKIIRNGKVYYVENRRRLNYYSSPAFNGWRWTINEPLMPVQSDSGLYIYTSNDYNHCYHAFGKWDFDYCSGTPDVNKILKFPFINQFIPTTVNRYTGSRVMDLFNLPVYDINCNTVTNPYTQVTMANASYIGVHGDSNTCFDVNYNMVFSPWSNPGIPINNPSDSLTIELVERKSNGSIDVNVYYTNMLQAAPSKPQFLKATKQYNSSPQGSFYVRLTWLRNREPDMSTYGIYKASTNTPGVDAVYSWIASTSDTTYLDQSILMFDPDSRNQGACPPQYNTYSYRVTAVDLTEKESCLSERDSISGYIDPCTEPPEGPDNILIESNNPKGNELRQNYPNPFNPVTRFEYSLKDNGHVKITIYDLTGKSIATLVNEYKLSGNYYAVFNAADINLSSGVYFYKIETAGFSQVRQMIIIK